MLPLNFYFYFAESIEFVLCFKWFDIYIIATKCFINKATSILVKCFTNKCLFVKGFTNKTTALNISKPGKSAIRQLQGKLIFVEFTPGDESVLGNYDFEETYLRR